MTILFKRRRHTAHTIGLTTHQEIWYMPRTFIKDPFWGPIIISGDVQVTVLSNEQLIETLAEKERVQVWSSPHTSGRGTPPRDKLTVTEAAVACLRGADPDNLDEFLSIAEFCYDEELDELTHHSLWDDIQDICYLYCVNEARPQSLDAYGRDKEMPRQLGFESIEKEIPSWQYYGVPPLIEDDDLVKVQGYTYTKKTKQWSKNRGRK